MITFLSRLTAVAKGSCWSTLFPLTHTMAHKEKKHQFLCVQDRHNVLIAWAEVKTWLLYQETGIPKGRVSTCLAKAGGVALSLGPQNWASSWVPFPCPRHGGKGGKGEYSNSMHLVGFGLLSHQPGKTLTEKGRISESSINAAYTVFIQS